MAPRKPALTLGIEEEYLLVDLKTRDLAQSPPPAFMRTCQDKLGERVTPELLQAQVEVGTSVCRTVSDARDELAHLRRTIADCARDFGMGLLAASTHPSASWRDQQHVDIERYRILSDDFQDIARRLVICGMHVHAGVEDDDLRIDLMNQVTYFLPHLLALSTSSPFWEGHVTGLKAFRPTIFGDLPRSGMPEQFESFSEWQDLVQIMDATGLCDDATKIWWDIRPSAKHPTLEMRICDVCTRLEDAISIAACYQSILAVLYRLRANNQTWRSYRRILLEENKWRAQRYGVEGTMADYGRQALVPVKELVDEIIELVRVEAQELECEAEVVRAAEIVTNGTSAEHQLNVYNTALSGGAEPEEARRDVVDWLMVTSLEGIAA